MTKKDTYTAEYTLDENGYWLVSIKEIPEVHTFGKRLAKAQAMVRDALALWLDVPVGSVEVVDDLASALGGHAGMVSQANRARERARVAAEEATDLTLKAAHVLVDELGLTVRDAAVFLEMSFQRVHQLLNR